MTWMPWGMPSFVFGLCTFYAATWTVRWRRGGLDASNWFARVALVLFGLEFAFCLAGLFGLLPRPSDTTVLLVAVGSIFLDVALAFALGSLLSSRVGGNRWVETVARVESAPGDAEGLVLTYTAGERRVMVPLREPDGATPGTTQPIRYQRDRPERWSGVASGAENRHRWLAPVAVTAGILAVALVMFAVAALVPH